MDKYKLYVKRQNKIELFVESVEKKHKIPCISHMVSHCQECYNIEDKVCDAHKIRQGGL